MKARGQQVPRKCISRKNIHVLVEFFIFSSSYNLFPRMCDAVSGPGVLGATYSLAGQIIVLGL